MSIEKITSKILREAEESKNKILSEAKSQSDAVLAEANKKASILVEKAEKKGVEDKEKVVVRRRSVSSIDTRKAVLNQKQIIISECFEKAIAEITGGDVDRYISILVNLGKNSGETSGRLIFNKNDRELVGTKVVDSLNKEIKGGAFELSDEVRNIKGGYMLECGSTYINNTIEALIEENREELTVEIANKLFAK